METITIELLKQYNKSTIDKILAIYSADIKMISSLYVRKTCDGYTLKLNIADKPEFNGVDFSKTVASIVDTVLLDCNKNTDIVYYVQSSLEILDKMYTPLMHKLASEMYDKWNKYITFEDLYQICRYSLCKLYKQGYYIHKSILQRTFKNDVLKEMAIHRDEPTLLSIYDDDSELLPLCEQISDIQQDAKLDDSLTDGALQAILRTVKPFIVKYIGERRYKLLLFDIENNCVTSLDRVTISRLRDYLKRNRFTNEWFKKKLGGD